MADEKLKKPAEEAVAEKQQVMEEVQKQTTKEAEVPKTEVIIQAESSELSNKTSNKLMNSARNVWRHAVLVQKRMKYSKREI
ncbi:hypothetical protein Hanom_Chr03g00218831 [Helianthus anomalus]